MRLCRFMVDTSHSINPTLLGVTSRALHQALHRVQAPQDLGASVERPPDPRPQEAAPKGGVRAVHEPHEAAPLTTVVAVAQHLQLTAFVCKCGQVVSA